MPAVRDAPSAWTVAVVGLFLLPGCLGDSGMEDASPDWVYTPVSKLGVVDVPLSTASQRSPDPVCVTLTALNETRILDFRSTVAWRFSHEAGRELTIEASGPGAPASDAQGTSPLHVTLGNLTLVEGADVELRIVAQPQMLPAVPATTQDVSFQVEFTHSRKPGETENDVHRILFAPTTACDA